MSRKDVTTDTEIADAMKVALDDLQRMQALMKGVVIAVDNMRNRVIFRHVNQAPGPWDDEHPDNRRDIDRL